MTWPLGFIRGPAQVFFVSAMFFLATFLVLTVATANRSFLIEAHTTTLDVVFGEGQNVWRLPEATVCIPLDVPDFASKGPCGIAFEAKGEPSEAIISWAENTKINVSTQSDALQITVLEAPGSDMIERSYFLLSAKSWKSAGALTFRASVIVGQDLQSGSRNLLLNGRWEAREAGLVTSFFRNVTEVVKQGTLPAGSKATVLIDGNPARVYGHFTQSEDNTLYVNVVSQLGNTALQLNSFGLDEPILIEPDWVDSAISSPLLLALAVFFSILASASQVFSDTSSITPRKEAEE
ncbi:hypothetical protein CFI11_09635 [Thalassococcus sp. S3]|nr:hypothetical protein CFI11_09635 [Thalassococcus sp. S3]